MTRIDLIERTLAGDNNAFESIFEQYKNLVYKTAFLMLDNATDAEDALQEVFLKVYRSLETYNPTKGAFSTWLYRITVNHCLNQRRKFLRFINPKELFTALDKQDPISLEDKISDKEVLQGALQTLSNKLYVVIILRYFLDLSYSEIAQVLDIPLGTVKSRLNLGLTKVRNKLNSDHFQDVPLREVSE